MRPRATDMYTETNRRKPVGSCLPQIETRQSGDLLLASGVIFLYVGGSIRVFSLALEPLEAIPSAPFLVLGELLIILSAMFQLGHGKIQLKRLSAGFRLWLFLMIMWAMVLIVSGLVKQNPAQQLIMEAFVTGGYLAGFLLGTSRQNWSQLLQLLWKCTWLIAVPATIVGLHNLESLSRLSIIASPLYRSEALLIPVCFFFLAADLSQGRWRWLGITLVVVLYGLLQVLALKRAPIMRISAVVLTGMVVIPFMKGQRSLRRVGLVVIIGVLLLVGAMTLADARRADDPDTLSGRFSSLVQSMSYSFGLSTDYEPFNYYEETYRVREVGAVFDAMSGVEKLIGTGFGGYVVSPEFASWDITEGRDAEGARELIVSSARSEVHVGMFWPFFKGGMVFWLIFYSAILVALVRFWGIRQPDRFDLACWAFLLIMVIFQLMEGHWMLPSLDLTALLVGACLGWLAIRATGVTR